MDQEESPVYSQLTVLNQSQNVSPTDYSPEPNVGTQKKSRYDNTWVRTHFNTQGLIRYCSFPGCKKSYSSSTAHHSLAKHWVIHGETSKLGKTIFDFSNDLVVDRLIKFIIAGQHEYRLVESREFKLFCKALNPRVKLVCRETLSELILKCQPKVEDLVRKKLEEASSLSLTFDIWSARKCSKGFAAVTAHYLDEQMKMKELSLDFSYIEYPHTQIVLRDYLDRVIEKWGIAHITSAITTDNASNNISGIEQLVAIKPSLNLENTLPFIHIRCAAHVINLGVQITLKELKGPIKNIKLFVEAITSSTKRSERFRGIQKTLINDDTSPIDIDVGFSRGKILNLVTDCETRWNSTFALLERAYLLRTAVDKAMNSMGELNEIERIDWNEIKMVIDWLWQFNEATRLLSGSKYSTISLLMMIVSRLRQHAMKQYDNFRIKAAAAAFMKKLSEYEPMLENEIACVAAVLDPRGKLNAVKLTMRDKTIEKITSCIVDLDREIDTSMTSVQFERESIFSDILSGTAREENELDSYLRSRIEPYTTDICMYWQLNKKVYPALYRLSRSVLHIQATSVAAERVFSMAGMVDTPRRNKLSSDSFSANMLINSWLKYLELK